MKQDVVAWCLFSVLLLSAGVHAQQLNGNLFTTPEQRSYLDALRQEFLAESRETGFDIEESEITPAPAPTTVEIEPRIEFTLGGIMTRRDGSHVIWLNNKSFSEAGLPDGIDLVSENNQLALRFHTDIGDKILFPGQTIEINSGAVRERYQGMRPPTDGAANDAQPR